MNDELKPALTPEQWTDQRLWRDQPNSGRDDSIDVKLHHDPNRGVGLEISHYDSRDSESYHDYPSDLIAIIALANAALPDDSQYKITREDVRAVGRAMEKIRRAFPSEFTVLVDLKTLAAKIAALLPP